MSDEGLQEVLFEVGVVSARGVYGLTLFVDDGSEPDVVACFRVMFRGAPGGEDSVAKAFSDCHREAMDSLGMTGEMTAEDFGERLVSSMDVASVLMSRYGYDAVRAEDVDEGTMRELWDDQMPDTDPPPAALN